MALTKPFCENGNKTTIPDTTSDGSVSYDQGFGAFYALPPEEGGLFIDRAQFNQLLFDTTSAVLENKQAIDDLNGATYTKTEVNDLLNTKANANATVNIAGNQTVNGIKTFSAPPISATNPANNNQVANKAYVDGVGNTAVKLTGAQTIQGVKTFTSIPISATRPTNANQVANKAYVDSVSGGIPDYSAGISVTFSTGGYTAPVNGAIMGDGNVLGEGSRAFYVNGELVGYDNDQGQAIYVPLRKGDVFTISSGSGSSTRNYFYPFN